MVVVEFELIELIGEMCEVYDFFVELCCDVEEKLVEGGVLVVVDVGLLW